MATPLQTAFAEAREAQDIGIILPVLLESSLFVVGKRDDHGQWLFFSKSSPRPERLCVTASETRENLPQENVDIREMSGLELLETMPENQEIIVVYSDGGDYISHEHLECYKGILAELETE